ncbi:hypothetical protein Hanom_Chr16g01463361 [Helianthus anomalus]
MHHSKQPASFNKNSNQMQLSFPISKNTSKHSNKCNSVFLDPKTHPNNLQTTNIGSKKKGHNIRDRAKTSKKKYSKQPTTSKDQDHTSKKTFKKPFKTTFIGPPLHP